MTNKQQIKNIVKSISITPDRRIFLHNKPWGEEFSNPYIKEPNNKILFQQLQQLIYTVFYTRSGETPKTSNFPSPQEIESYTSELSRHNSGIEQFDPGWQIEQIDMQGMMTASKGNHKRLIFPGEFVNDSSFHQKPGVNTLVRLYGRKEHKDLHAGFYYVFGKTLAEDNNESLVRVYFNIKPDAAKELIALLTVQLNKYSVPFSFKCLYHPSLFTRCDTAVLYFDKRYSRIIFRLLPDICASISKGLNESTPLFTKKIGKGVSFAENPANPEESFGTHISKMITQGLMHCITKNIPPAQWEAEVIANIEKRHGYGDVEKLHLNPGTSYPYLFPTINLS